MNKYVLQLLLCLSFSMHCIAQVDTTVGLSVSKSDARDYKTLAHALCDGLQGDQVKASAIYNWITHNIRYDVSAMEKGKMKPDKVEKILKNRKGVCEGYAKLFSAMCNEVGLKAINIDGYAKDWIFDNGDQLIIPRHMWSAVLINGKWEFADPTWGAGVLVQSPTVIRKIINKVTFRKIVYAKKLKFQYRYNPEYFAQDPLTFRLKHLPSDPYWQLTDTAMPLEVFEAGDSAVMAFNKKYGQIKQNNSELMRISALDEDSVMFEASERAYAFNGRFPLALALRQNARVNDDVNKVLKEKDPEKGAELWKDAESALKKAQTHVKEQKKYFPDQYNGLKKKNRTKKTEAKQYMAQIKIDDKKLVSQCGQYKRSADTKYKKIKKKYVAIAAKKKGLDAGKVNKQEPSKMQKSKNAPEVVELLDSIKTRKLRIDTMQIALDEKAATIRKYQVENAQRLDSLADRLGASDSFLVNEAKARIQMQDNYDDDVIKWSSLYKTSKYKKADTLHKYYVAYFDSVILLSTERQKVKATQLDAYKNNLKDIEKYGKWYSADTGVAANYADMVNSYEIAIDSCKRELLITAAYIKGNKKLFDNMSKLYKRQLKIVAYMSKVEDMRQKLELNTIKNKQSFDINENKKQEADLKMAMKKMEKVYK